MSRRTAKPLTWAFAGIKTSNGDVDLKALVDQKDQLVSQLRKDKYEDLIDHYQFDLIRGTARFTGSDTLDVAGRTLHANRFYRASQSVPYRWILATLPASRFRISAIRPGRSMISLRSFRSRIMIVSGVCRITSCA